MAARSNALVCGRSLAGVAGSNPAGSMDVSVVSVVCCQVEVSPYRGVLPRARVCVCVCECV